MCHPDGEQWFVKQVLVDGIDYWWGDTFISQFSEAETEDTVNNVS